MGEKNPALSDNGLSASGLSALLLCLQRHVVGRPDAWDSDVVDAAGTVTNAVAQRLPHTEPRGPE